MYKTTHLTETIPFSQPSGKEHSEDFLFHFLRVNCDRPLSLCSYQFDIDAFDEKETQVKNKKRKKRNLSRDDDRWETIGFAWSEYWHAGLASDVNRRDASRESSPADQDPGESIRLDDRSVTRCVNHKFRMGQPLVTSSGSIG